jgi:hypothetical protein
MGRLTTDSVACSREGRTAKPIGENLWDSSVVMRIILIHV